MKQFQWLKRMSLLRWRNFSQWNYFISISAEKLLKRKLNITLTSEFLAQCSKDPLYFLSFTITAPISWSMRSFRHPLLWCFIARWPGYAWPHGIKGSAPFSNNIFNIVSCESLIATWIGDSVYLVILSMPSFKSFPITTNWE